MNFLVDMPISPILASWLNKQGHNAVHASDIAMHKAKDTDIITEARMQKRIIITADLDFPQLLATSHASDPGIVPFRGGNYSLKLLYNAGVCPVKTSRTCLNRLVGTGSL